jgi:hypothetical protein
MTFPWAVVKSPAELPVGAFDGPVAVAGSAVAGAPCGYGKKTETQRRIALPLDSGFDGAAAAAGSALVGAGEDDAGAGAAAAGAADVPPTMLT